MAYALQMGYIQSTNLCHVSGPIVQKVKEGKVNLAKDQECWVFADGSEKDGKVE